MSRQRRTADDFVRDMKAKQQNRTTSEIQRKTSEGLTPEQAVSNGAKPSKPRPARLSLTRQSQLM